MANEIKIGKYTLESSLQVCILTPKSFTENIFKTPSITIDLKQDLIEDDYTLGTTDFVMQMNYSMEKGICENKEYCTGTDNDMYILDEYYRNVHMDNIVIVEYDSGALIDRDYEDRKIAEADMLDVLEEFYKH